ncbi:MAG: agmatinase, partial [Bacteroidetes bacterium]
LFPVPWEVTVSYGAGTARAADHIFTASLQVDLYDPDGLDLWKKGYYMPDLDKKMLLKSDYLRKEAELYINFISKGDDVDGNKFMCKSLRDINEGSNLLNNWVYEQTKAYLDKGKKVALVGGDHSTPLGFFKALGEKFGSFGILQIDAHCDLRKSYEDFKYSHASVMYNALEENQQIEKLVQVGIRDYCQEEYDYIAANPRRITTYFDQQIRERQFEGETWKQIVDDIIAQLPQKVYLSFDIDGLDPKLCPNTGTPVQGGFEAEQILYLVRKLVASGRQLIGFDLVEVGVGESDWDANVGARILFKLCNQFMKSTVVNGY